jgi:hypothetical protein
LAGQLVRLKPGETTKLKNYHERRSIKIKQSTCFPLYSASRLITKAYKPYLDEMGLRIQIFSTTGIVGKRWTLCKSNYGEGLNTINISFALLKRNGKWNSYNALVLIEDERSVIVQLTEKEVNSKEQAKPISEKTN